jgi:hypothetical protein
MASEQGRDHAEHRPQGVKAARWREVQVTGSFCHGRAPIVGGQERDVTLAIPSEGAYTEANESMEMTLCYNDATASAEKGRSCKRQCQTSDRTEKRIGWKSQ